MIDPDSIRVILDHRADQPTELFEAICSFAASRETELFKLDGRPQLAGIRVAVTDVSAYKALLTHDTTVSPNAEVAS